ncbi:MAG TPA: Hg(II)-responsive transcriptional regulator [Ktedonobacterales bacterium]
MTATLTIGRLARLAGVNVETIRYYQRRGLVEEPARLNGGYRQYPAEAVSRLHFIKRAQALGFSLEEVAALLGLSRASACAETRAVAVRKVVLIDRKLADLAAMRAALADLVIQCDANQADQVELACPIIVALAREERPING